MNTNFLNWCRALMSKRGVLVLAEFLCLIAVASAFLVVHPLVQASNHGYGGDDAAEDDAEDDAAENDAAAAEKKVGGKASASASAVSVKATFKSIVTTISKDPSSGDGDTLGTTANVVSHMTFNDVKSDPWLIVTVRVKGKPETFGATAFLDLETRKAKVWIAEVLPPSNPDDPKLRSFIGKTLILTGIN